MAAPDNEQRSNWESATLPSDEILRLILQIVREHYEQQGDWPTAKQLRAKLQRPGA